MRFSRPFLFAALIAVAIPKYGVAQTALDLADATSRPVQILVVRQTVDAMGNLVDGTTGAPQPSALTANGGNLNATLKAVADGSNAAIFPPLALGGNIMVNFSAPMFAGANDQVTTLDPRTGAARISRMTSGSITANVNALGLMIMQPIMFSLVDFAATDMGPLFLALRTPRMPTMAAGGPANMMNAAARVVCAKAGSPFLMMNLGIPDCAATTTRTDPTTMTMTTTPTFMDPRQIDPKAFDPRTGEIRPVGVQVIRIAPFMVAGIPINLNPIVRFKLDAVQRITEAN